MALPYSPRNKSAIACTANKLSMLPKQHVQRGQYNDTLSVQDHPSLHNRLRYLNSGELFYNKVSHWQELQIRRELLYRGKLFMGRS
mmetsp:Transcript_18435/g.3002  ORF Transcript_18435/g.3002 Transcript_18435/m.3002 type:complete len:86 (+) Transcript_18435:851-1108(+)